MDINNIKETRVRRTCDFYVYTHMYIHKDTYV